MEDYLELIEEHQHNKVFNAFEKVLVAAQRAKILHDLEEPSKAVLPHKPSYQALLEIKKGLIQSTYEAPPKEVSTPKSVEESQESAEEH